MVFGVCLTGVAALYLMPSTTGSPAGVGSPAQRDLPTARPSVATVVSVATPALSPTAATPATYPLTTAVRAGQTGADRPGSRPMATAGRPGTDQSPPDAVGALTVTRVDAERLTVTWPAAGDDVGVVSYSVWLNGFFVASTQQPRAILPWFNDSSTHVVQVRALDAVGNVGASSPTLLVVRPSPSPGAATPVAGTENPGPSPAPRPTDVGEAETPNTEHTPAPPSGTQRSSDAEKEESS